MTSSIPTSLARQLSGRYVIERELGRGGMATVFLAQDLKHGRRVAIKMMRPELLTAFGTERFLREIQVAARLQHPHILPLFDSGAMATDEGAEAPYYVMPYVAGETLRDRLDRERQLGVPEALRIAEQIGAALAYAHGQSIVHRDIKPQNILLSEGEAIVADFGIAKALSQAVDASATATGLVLGTPSYMSPEQATGDATLDGRSDIYSLACVVFEMLAGEPPFSGSVQALIGKHVAAPPPRIRELRAGTPVEVEQALQCALAKLPADRFGTARQFIDALTSVASSQPLPPRATAPNLGPLVSKTCNRWRQVNAFDAAFRASRKAFGRKPQVYAITGEEGAAHESLIDRLLATRISHFAEEIGGQARGTAARIRVPWPEGEDLATASRDLAIAIFREVDPSYMGDELSAAALVRLGSLTQYPVIVIQHEVRARHWARYSIDLLRWYVDAFWGSLNPAALAQQFVIFLKIVYPEERRGGLFGRLWRADGGGRALIQRELHAALEGCVNRSTCMVLRELEPVTADDVREWFHANGIVDSEHRREALARRIFRDAGTLRLAEVESALEEILKSFRTEQEFAQGTAL